MPSAAPIAAARDQALSTPMTRRCARKCRHWNSEHRGRTESNLKAENLDAKTQRPKEIQETNGDTKPLEQTDKLSSRESNGNRPTQSPAIFYSCSGFLCAFASNLLILGKICSDVAILRVTSCSLVNSTTF